MTPLITVCFGIAQSFKGPHRKTEKICFPTWRGILPLYFNSSYKRILSQVSEGVVKKLLDPEYRPVSVSVV